MLSRLQEVIATCTDAYAEYDFRKVFQTLNQFVTVEVSALYVDITKDRLYCDAAGSPRRRATQEVMRQVFEALCQLLAPMLAFTADEAWEYAGHTSSVHLERFPAREPHRRNSSVEATVDQWLKLRGTIAQAIEAARQQKLIGNGLEATVTVEIADAAALAEAQAHTAELEEFLILSEVKCVAGNAMTATVEKNPNARCGRCWRHRASVGFDARHPELCDRCAEVVGGGK